MHRMKRRKIGPLEAAPRLPKSFSNTINEKEAPQQQNSVLGTLWNPVRPRKTGKVPESSEIPPIPTVVVAMENAVESHRKKSFVETDDESSINGSCTSRTGVYFNDLELTRSLHPLQVCSASNSVASVTEHGKEFVVTTDSTITQCRPLLKPPRLIYRKVAQASPKRVNSKILPHKANIRKDGRIKSLVMQLKNAALLGRKRARQPSVVLEPVAAKPPELVSFVPPSAIPTNQVRPRLLSRDEIEAATSLAKLEGGGMNIS